MMKKCISVFIAALLLAIAFYPVNAAGITYSNGSTGEMVVRIQIRLAELGYLNYKATGAYRSMTVEAVKAFQQRCCDVGNNVQIDGAIGDQTMQLLFAKNAPRAKIPDSVHIAIGPIHETLEITGDIMAWNDVKAQLTVGEIYKATDCNTGRNFSLIFSGGVNHAEMELASSEELDEFMKICGDEFNYYKRPVLIEIGGRQIAASIQCYPHGSETIADNGMNGHICVFFKDSLSHVGQLPDVEHNANVYAASGQ